MRKQDYDLIEQLSVTIYKQDYKEILCVNRITGFN